MAEPNFTFRAALHGFNRSDVITYLSELAAAHAAQLEEKEAQLLSAQDENARLQQELASMKALIEDETDAAGIEDDENEADAEAIEDPSPADDFEIISEPDADNSVVNQELEAYRRAERCEREARQRAGKVYEEACAAVDSAKRRLNEQEVQLSEMSESLSQSVNALQEMLAQISDNLGQTRDSIQKMEDGLKSANE